MRNLHTAHWMWLTLTARCLMALLGLVRLRLVFPYGSASVFLCFCLWILLFLRVFLLVSACVAPCFCLGFSLFLRVSSPCVPRCFCLCFSLFLLLLPMFSACVSLCFCLCSPLVLLVVVFVVACVFAWSAWVCLCLLHCFCTSLWLLCFIRLWCWRCCCLLSRTAVQHAQAAATARLFIVILQALLLLLLFSGVRHVFDQTTASHDTGMQTVTFEQMLRIRMFIEHSTLFQICDYASYMFKMVYEYLFDPKLMVEHVIIDSDTASLIMPHNAASMTGTVIIGLDFHRWRDQRCKTSSKSGLASRNQAKSLEFRHFC